MLTDDDVKLLEQTADSMASTRNGQTVMAAFGNSVKKVCEDWRNLKAQLADWESRAQASQEHGLTVIDDWAAKCSALTTERDELAERLAGHAASIERMEGNMRQAGTYIDTLRAENAKLLKALTDIQAMCRGAGIDGFYTIRGV